MKKISTTKKKQDVGKFKLTRNRDINMHDSVEDTKEYKAIEAEMELKVSKLAGARGAGYSRRYWAAKKKVLKEDYGINWKSPKDLNPEVKYD